MAEQRYLRSVRVTIGDAESAVLINGPAAAAELLVRFDLRKEASPTPAAGHVDVYNLQPETERRIRERGTRVVLEAGYGSSPTLIFDGDVRRVHRMRERLNRVTRVIVGGSVAKQSRAVFMRSYEGDVAVRDIVRDGVAALGLTLGPVDLIPEDAVETDFRYNGPARTMITWRLNPLGIEWYEENGVVRFNRFSQTADDRPQGFVVSERTGMVGTPTVTDDGVEVRTILDPRFALDVRFRIDSAEVEEASRPWKCVAVRHHGDNREGPFETVANGKPIGFSTLSADRQAVSAGAAP